MKLIAGILPLALVASVVHAANWVNFAETERATTYQFDTSSVKWRGLVATVWMRGFYKNVNEYGVKSFVERQAIDCNNRDMVTVLSDISYDAAGKVLTSTVATQQSPAPPGSVSEGLVTTVCNLRGAN